MNQVRPSGRSRSARGSYTSPDKTISLGASALHVAAGTAPSADVREGTEKRQIADERKFCYASRTATPPPDYAAAFLTFDPDEEEGRNDPARSRTPSPACTASTTGAAQPQREHCAVRDRCSKSVREQELLSEK